MSKVPSKSPFATYDEVSPLMQAETRHFIEFLKNPNNMAAAMRRNQVIFDAEVDCKVREAERTAFVPTEHISLEHMICYTVQAQSWVRYTLEKLEEIGINDDDPLKALIDGGMTHWLEMLEKKHRVDNRARIMFRCLNRIDVQIAPRLRELDLSQPPSSPISTKPAMVGR